MSNSESDLDQSGHDEELENIDALVESAGGDESEWEQTFQELEDESTATTDSSQSNTADGDVAASEPDTGEEGRSQTGTLRVEAVSELGTTIADEPEVLVDGQPISSTAVEVPYGEHTIEVTADRYKSATRDVVVDSAEQTLTITLSLPPIRSWTTETINIPPRIEDDLYDRKREFRNAYEDEHRTLPSSNAHFWAAVCRAALSDRSLDDILTEVIEDDLPYVE